MSIEHKIAALAPLLLAAGAVWTAQPATAESHEKEGPLAPFERLVGGRWQLGDDFYQTFEWTIGKKAVTSRGYFVIEGEPKLVSEGMWFWHPGEEKIKGYFVNIDMPTEFIDYTTRFEGDKMLSEIDSYSPTGGLESFTESWDFSDDDHYEWSLYTAEEGKRAMGGTYTRVVDE